MNQSKFIGAVLAAVLLMSACSDKDVPAPAPSIPKKTPEEAVKLFSAAEESRKLSRENAETLASVYRSDNPRLSGTRIVGHADSTISVDCLQGDGWASVTFLGKKKDESPNDIERYGAVCSTVSESLGCYLRKDFEEKPFAREEGHCNPNLPYPLPKLNK